MYLSPRMHFVGEKNRDLLYRVVLNRYAYKETNINKRDLTLYVQYHDLTISLLVLLGLSVSFWDSNEKFGYLSNSEARCNFNFQKRV